MELGLRLAQLVDTERIEAERHVRAMMQLSNSDSFVKCGVGMARFFAVTLCSMCNISFPNYVDASGSLALRMGLCEDVHNACSALLTRISFHRATALAHTRRARDSSRLF